MKPIGELLLYLLRPDVAELGLVSNRLPSANVGGRFVPVDEKAPTTEAILDILAVVGGSLHVQHLGPKALQWNTRIDGVGVINVAGILRDNVVQVRFTLAKRETIAPNVPPSAPTEPRMSKPSGNGPHTQRLEIEMPVLMDAEDDDDDLDEPTLQTVSERPPAMMAARAAAIISPQTPPMAVATQPPVSKSPLPPAPKAAQEPFNVPDLVVDIRRTAPLSFDGAPAGAPATAAEMSRAMSEALADMGFGGPQGDISSGLEIDDGRRIDGAPVDPARLGPTGHRAKHHTPVNIQAAVVSGQQALPQGPALPLPERPSQSHKAAPISQAPQTQVPQTGPMPVHYQQQLPPGAKQSWTTEMTMPIGTERGAMRSEASDRLGATRVDAAPVPEPDDPARVQIIERFLGAAIQRGATDVHFIAERPVLLRVAGNLLPLDQNALSPADVERICMAVLPGRLRELLDRDGSCDFALVHPRLARFRANVSRQRTGYKLALRVIPHKVPTLQSLGLPESIANATKHHQGLIVVTGPTGHGKTTTLAAIVNLINEHSAHHVITVEDPIEYLHPRKKAMISQREVGTHTKSFFAALKGSLREDPDVIVVGELRDLETVRMAVAAAETGHLVLGTMNTPSASKTIDRIIDMFPPQDQAQIRITLAGALRLIVSQRLVPTTDGRRVVAAAELLPGSLSLTSLIRDNKTFQIPSLQQRGKSMGIIRLNESLHEHVTAGRITMEAARAVSDNLADLEAMANPKPSQPGALVAPAAARR